MLCLVAQSGRAGGRGFEGITAAEHCSIKKGTGRVAGRRSFMRAVLSVFALVALTMMGVGCQNVQRIGCEAKHFYFDVQRLVFGVDCPHGNAESTHSQYYGMEPPGRQSVC